QKAESKPEGIDYSDTGQITSVETPDIKTIEQLTEFLKISAKNTIKSLVYKTSESKYVLALIRGDLDMNETKLKNYLNVPEIMPADPEETKENLGIPLGFAGPVGVKNVTIVADHTVQDIKGGVTGANKPDLHYINVNADRDFKPDAFEDLRLTGEGDQCPDCGSKLNMFRGIELGHIFKLGDKYSKAFSVSYLDEDGTPRIPIMGCYGIGVERTAAAVIEQNHDDDGIKWPITVAPFQVHILTIKHEGKVQEISESIHGELEKMGIEVLLDDREERAGIKFKDADLIGFPIQVIIGEKNLQKGKVEIKARSDRKVHLIDNKEVIDILKKS
ncbi:MAG: proline--tRNA ligase, partial [Spirochaetes bacterium]|nr:proline--tRNA ligase [Spirochaetota bacterium]